MRALIQRVTQAAVSIDGQQTAAIGSGLLIFLCVMRGDTETDTDRLARKIANLRIFADDEKPMNRSLPDINGQALVVSQFTLAADLRKGNRPGFENAAPTEIAKPLYEQFCSALQAQLPSPIATGTFAADMQITLTNDGPVTLHLDTRKEQGSENRE